MEASQGGREAEMDEGRLMRIVMPVVCLRPLGLHPGLVVTRTYRLRWPEANPDPQMSNLAKEEVAQALAHPLRRNGDLTVADVEIQGGMSASSARCACSSWRLIADLLLAMGVLCGSGRL
jgi:hypothetical protein